MLRPPHHVRRPVEDAGELHAIVVILETLAVRSAPPPEPRAIDELRAANGRVAAAGDDRAAAAGAEAELHALLTEPCGDVQVLRLLEDARTALDRVAPAPVAGGAEVARAIREHAAIIDALAAGDPERAAERLRVHPVRRRPAARSR
jgi:DNA-binding GntR family transcriptional regulator